MGTVTKEAALVRSKRTRFLIAGAALLSLSLLVFGITHGPVAWIAYAIGVVGCIGLLVAWNRYWRELRG